MDRLAIGHIVDGTYRVDEVVSETERAHVYGVQHQRFPDAKLVLKVVPAALMQDFDRDTSALAGLTSPCVARVCDRGVLKDGRPYRVVERLAGPSLREALSTTAFSDDRAMELVVAIAAAVYEARANGMGPCDVSVDNLFFADGRASRLCLLRAVVPGGKMPDHDADQAGLSALRVALERGHAAALADGAWKAPVSVAEFRNATKRSRTSSDGSPGTKISHWRVVRTISETLNATVYEVADKVCPSAALKIAGPNASAEAFARQTRILSTVKSPHVVRIHELGSHEGTLHAAMELLQGDTLAASLRANGPFTIDAALRAAVEMLTGAEAIERVSSDAVDFSLEHCHEALNANGTTRVVLTHIAPPLARFSRFAGGAGTGSTLNAWSATVALYELIAGRLPFPTSRHSLARVWMGIPVPLGSRRRDVPPLVSRLVNDLITGELKMTSKDLAKALADLRRDSTAVRAHLPAPVLDRPSVAIVVPPPRHPKEGVRPTPSREWRLETSPSICPISPLTAAAIRADEIVVASRDAIARYRRGKWTVDPAREIAGGLRTIVAVEGDAYLAIAANGTLFRLGKEGGFLPWGPAVSRHSFYGIIPQAGGVTLVGGSTDWGRGSIARLVGESLTIVAEELGVRTLYGGTFLSDGSMLAVGSGGGIVRVRGGAAIELANPCNLDLLVAATVGDDLVVTGSGAWAFRVTTAPLTTELEPVDTSSGLTCIAVDEDGTGWSGTDTGRIMCRRDRHWRRMSKPFSGDPPILAIQATSMQVRAVLADGRIVLGQPAR